MRRRSRNTLLMTLVLALITAGLPPISHDQIVPLGLWPIRAAATSDGLTTLVSISTAGVQASADSTNASISADGRSVAFASAAADLVGDDTNGVADVFVRDRVAGTTVRVSISSSGEQANGASSSPAIARDGRWVAFTSSATNLVSGDTNGYPDVFLHDLQTGTTTRVSVTSDGSQGAGQSFEPQISGDGRYIAFHTYSDLAGSGALTGMPNAYRVDRTTGRVEDLCVRWDGVFLRLCLSPAISDDGRYVAFEAQGKLAVEDANNTTDIYVRDMVAGTTTRVSVSSAGAEANNQSVAPSISSDGRFVAFRSHASNLVTGDTNGFADVFIRDIASATTERVSVATDGSEANDQSFTRDVPVGSRLVSADGRYVAFESNATNLVTGDSNGAIRDVFIRDRTASTTAVVSIASSDQQGNSTSARISISDDGSIVAFHSQAVEPRQR